MNVVRNERGAEYEVGTGVSVKRAVGFAPAFDFVAEVTEEVDGKLVTAREGSYTAEGAVTRARMAVRERGVFAGFKRAVGFAAAGVVRDGSVASGKFKVGFA
jgi:hypothetical protein